MHHTGQRPHVQLSLVPEPVRLWLPGRFLALPKLDDRTLWKTQYQLPRHGYVQAIKSSSCAETSVPGFFAPTYPYIAGFVAIIIVLKCIPKLISRHKAKKNAGALNYLAAEHS